MTDKLIRFLTIGVFSAIGIVVLGWWFMVDPTASFSESVPGLDNRPANLQTAMDVVNIGEFFERYHDNPLSTSGSWPRFRGADYDNISKQRIPLLGKTVDPEQAILWSLELGEGHAAPVVSDGRVYIMDYDEQRRADALRCLSLKSGEEIWRRWYRIHVKRNHGMSRTIPAIKDNYIVTIGPRCHVMCVDADSGSVRWGIDLVQKFDTEVPLWYTGQCPLIENGEAVIAPGGSSLMIGIDCESGNINWQTPNPNEWKMSHSSIVPMNIAGKQVYIYAAIGGVVAVSAEETDRGKIVWQTKVWNHNVIAPTPVALPDDRIFLTSGYAAGGMVVKLSRNQQSYRIDVVQQYSPGEGLASEQQTPILFKNHLFGILPKDAAALRNQFVCYDAADCQKLVWSSGKTNRFGLGPYLLADNKFFILSDDGVLTIARASTSGYEQLAQLKILNGVDAWGPLVIVDGLLLARDSKRMVCVDIRTMNL